MRRSLTSCVHDRLAVRTLAFAVRRRHSEGVLQSTLQTGQLAVTVHPGVAGHGVSVGAHCLAGVVQRVGTAVPGQQGGVVGTVDRDVQLRRGAGRCSRGGNRFRFSLSERLRRPLIRLLPVCRTSAELSLLAHMLLAADTVTL